MLLEICPFCGSLDLIVKSEDVCGGHGVFYTNIFVFCENCHGHGPSYSTYYGLSNEVCKDFAVVAWNKRS